jgi:hypothetical protein
MTAQEMRLDASATDLRQTTMPHRVGPAAHMGRARTFELWRLPEGPALRGADSSGKSCAYEVLAQAPLIIKTFSRNPAGAVTAVAKATKRNDARRGVMTDHVPLVRCQSVHRAAAGTAPSAERK